VTEEIGIVSNVPVMYLKARRRANKRSQNIYQGRINNAVRQKRYQKRYQKSYQKSYRERLKQKVTYQGSKAQSVSDLLFNKRKCAVLTFEVDRKRHTKDLYCYFCNKICSPFLRADWLRASDYNKRSKVTEAKKLIFG
jgi:hypothetical protein